MADSNASELSYSTESNEDKRTNDDVSDSDWLSNFVPPPEPPWQAYDPESFGANYGSNHDAILNLLITGAYADCEIQCNGHVWKAHQNILCPRNPYFERTFNGAFQEARTKIVKWDDEEPWAAEGLLTFLYTAYCPCGKICLPKPQSHVEVHLKLVQIADRRLAAGLRQRAFGHLREQLRGCESKKELSAVVKYIRASGVLIDDQIGFAIFSAIKDMYCKPGSKSPDIIEALWEKNSLEYYVVKRLLMELRHNKSCGCDRLSGKGVRDLYNHLCFARIMEDLQNCWDTIRMEETE